MKQLLLFIVFCLPFIALAHDGRGCNTDSYTEWLWRKNPGLKEKMERENAALEEEMHKRSVIEKRQITYTIPVVVHIVYKDTATNLPYNKIYDQIVRLNKDYRRLNDDRNNTISQFQPVVADANIQFVFADTDPNGQPTTGITRTLTSVTEFASPSDPGFNNSCQKAINGGIDVWDRTRYMNIWVCLLSGTTLGYAQLPGGPANTDGIVIDTAYFGADPGNGNYDLGRTLTHESGHWFNLQHTWGPGSGSCAQDDGVTDTPNTDQAHYGCPLNTIACTELSMVQNYMDYTDDDCMNAFTQGQVDRMRAELTGAGRRTVLPLSGYSGVIPGINDNYTDPFSTTGDALTGGGSSSDNLIGNFLGFEIPGIGPWGTLAVIIVGGVLVIVFLAACLGCLCCGGGRD